MLKELEPTEEELKAYYDKHKDEFKTAEASHILVKTKEEAEAIKKNWTAAPTLRNWPRKRAWIQAADKTAVPWGNSHRAKW